MAIAEHTKTKKMLNRQISSMEIDLDGRCDFQCPFCYFTKKLAAGHGACDHFNNSKFAFSDDKKFAISDGNRLSFQEIAGIIDQAKQIGVQKIVLFNKNSSMPAAYDNSSHKSKLSNDEAALKKNNNLTRKHSKLHGASGFYDKNNTCNIQNIDELIDFIRMQNMQVEIRSSGSCMGMAALQYNDIQCTKHKFSCFVTYDGIVYPCAGTPLSIGNLRETTLDKIINDSEVFENLVNHENMIKGPCRECDSFSNCYGCRGRALSLTGDYLASDPLCTKNKGKSGMINYLPMAVADLIPQKRGMRLVSVLLTIGERCAEVESVFSRKSPFIKEDGTLEEIAYMEIMAQSAAVMNGFTKLNTGAPEPKGFLIGGQDIRIYTKTRAGEKLKTWIYKTVRFGNFGILTAKITRNQDLIAQGEIKIYQYDDENNDEIQ